MQTSTDYQNPNYGNMYAHTGGAYLPRGPYQYPYVQQQQQQQQQQQSQSMEYTGGNPSNMSHQMYPNTPDSLIQISYPSHHHQQTVNNIAQTATNIDTTNRKDSSSKSFSTNRYNKINSNYNRNNRGQNSNYNNNNNNQYHYNQSNQYTHHQNQQQYQYHQQQQHGYNNHQVIYAPHINSNHDQQFQQHAPAAAATTATPEYRGDFNLDEAAYYVARQWNTLKQPILPQPPSQQQQQQQSTAIAQPQQQTYQQ
jgi:G3E family GTPase